MTIDTRVLGQTVVPFSTKLCTKHREKEEIYKEMAVDARIEGRRASKGSLNKGAYVRASWADWNIEDASILDTVFNGGVVEGCLFKETLFLGDAFIKSRFEKTVFEQCQFIDVDLTGTLFKDCIFNDVLFTNSTLINSMFDTMLIKGVFEIEGCTIRGLKIINPTSLTSLSVSHKVPSLKITKEDPAEALTFAQGVPSNSQILLDGPTDRRISLYLERPLNLFIEVTSGDKTGEKEKEIKAAWKAFPVEDEKPAVSAAVEKIKRSQKVAATTIVSTGPKAPTSFTSPTYKYPGHSTYTYKKLSKKATLFGGGNFFTPSRQLNV